MKDKNRIYTERLKQARKEKNLTLKEMAELLDITQQLPICI